MQEQKSAWFVGYLALMRIKKYMQKANSVVDIRGVIGVIYPTPLESWG